MEFLFYCGFYHASIFNPLTFEKSFTRPEALPVALKDFRDSASFIRSAGPFSKEFCQWLLSCLFAWIH
jgi:hypothetical protein